MGDEGILVMIGYEIEIGFAIGRLLPIFLEAAAVAGGGHHKVHFSFSQVGRTRSRFLPDDFDNVTEFDPSRPTRSHVERFCAYLRENRITCIFALDLPVEAHFLPSLRDAGVRRIVSYWGAPMSSVNRGLKLLLKRLEVRLLRRSRPDHFVFESRAMERCAVEGRGIPRRDTSVIPTGVDPAEFRPKPSSADAVYDRFDIPRWRRVIVYTGHLHRRKGVHVLMRAAGILKEQHGRDDIHVLFLGNREGEIAEFKEDCRDGSPLITFGGYQSDIPELLSGCYLGCIPSSGWDSFPMSSLEMQACGLPVVVSDLQGVPETVIAGVTGLVVPAGDPTALAEAIVELVSDPQRRRSMSEAARDHIESELTRDLQIHRLGSRLRDVAFGP